MVVLCWHLTFLQQGQSCFSMHLYGPYTFIWEKCWEFYILDISSIIQLNRNLMMSIKAPSRHKIVKWADRKSKIAATAAILKINFCYLFPNLWLFWAETCSVAIGWLLDQNELVMSKVSTMATVVPLHWTRWPPKLKIENQTTSRPWPMARF